MGTAARMAAAERRDSCADESRCVPETHAHVNGDKRLAASTVLGRMTLLALIAVSLDLSDLTLPFGQKGVSCVPRSF